MYTLYSCFEPTHDIARNGELQQEVCVRTSSTAAIHPFFFFQAGLEYLSPEGTIDTSMDKGAIEYCHCTVYILCLHSLCM